MNDLRPSGIADDSLAPALGDRPQPPPLPPSPSAPVFESEADRFVAAFVDRAGAGDAVPGAPQLAVSDEGWQVTTPSPWRRYFARQLDVLVLGTLAWMCAAFVVASIDGRLFDRIFNPVVLENQIVSAFLTTLIVVPILAVVIGLTGTSPGKWLFGVRVTRRDGRPIGLADGLRRELAVYVKGFGLALPLVSLITLVMSYQHLTDRKVAAWDRDQLWVVTHRPDGALQVGLFVFGVVAMIAFRVAMHFA